jgi:hypothetical protein
MSGVDGLEDETMGLMVAGGVVMRGRVMIVSGVRARKGSAISSIASLCINEVRVGATGDLIDSSSSSSSHQPDQARSEF